MSDSPTPSAPAVRATLKTDIVVIGAGQAGLSSAYHLRRRALPPNRGFIVLDQSPQPGGAWQFRWPSLKLSTVNRIHDLPGMRFSEAVDTDATEVEASVAVPQYFAAYETAFSLPVYRPVKVIVVCDRSQRLRIETDRGDVSARGIINATGTWESPYVPDYPGKDRFAGRQLHTRDYRTAEEFTGKHVIVVGGGISAIQLLDEISRVTTTTWVTRRVPEFRAGPFSEERGRAAVALVEDRVRRGLPPNSVVSVTGLPITPAIEAMQARGVLKRLPMFSEILEDGVRWEDGSVLHVDVILWCTGFRSSLDHLAPLMLREASGGITMTGRLATQVAKDPRIHLVGYGPSASTIGANRAGAAAARELMAILLGLGRAYEFVSAWGQARDGYRELLEWAQTYQDSHAEADALSRLATVEAQGFFDLAQAQALLGQARAVAERSGDASRLAEIEWNLAQISFYCWDLERSLAHGMHGLDLALDLGGQELEARSRNIVAYNRMMIGRWDEAIVQANRARGLFTVLGNRALKADCLSIVAIIQVNTGRVADGIAAARAGVAIGQEVENPWGLANCAHPLTRGLLDQGEWGEALEVARAGVAAARAAGHPPTLVFNLLALGAVYRAHAALEAARATHAEARAIGEAMWHPLLREWSAIELCADYGDH